MLNVLSSLRRFKGWLAGPDRVRHRWGLVAGTIAWVFALGLGILFARGVDRPAFGLWDTVGVWVRLVVVVPAVAFVFGWQIWLELVPGEATLLRGGLAGAAIAISEHAVVLLLAFFLPSTGVGTSPVLAMLFVFVFSLIWPGFMTVPFGAVVGLCLAYAQSSIVDAPDEDGP